MSFDRYAWWRALRESDLSPTARHVALTISTYMNKAGENAWPHMGTLAADTGRSRRVVARAVRELQDSGYLEVESGGGRRPDGGYFSNRYSIGAPSDVVGVSDDTDDMDRASDPDHLAMTSEHGAMTSEHGAMTWASGSDDVGGIRTTHELALQPSKQHSAPTERAAAPLESSSFGEDEDQEQGQDQETAGERARAHGVTIGREIERGRLTFEQAADMFDRAQSLEGYWEEYRAGLKDGVETTRLEVA